MTNKLIVVSRKFQPDFAETDNIIRDLLNEKYGIENEGGGAGFGERNLDFTFKDSIDLKVLQKELRKKINDKSITVDIYEY